MLTELQKNTGGVKLQKGWDHQEAVSDEKRRGKIDA